MRKNDKKSGKFVAEKESISAVVAAKVTPYEQEFVTEWARENGLSVSEWVRLAINEKLKRDSLEWANKPMAEIVDCVNKKAPAC